MMGSLLKKKKSKISSVRPSTFIIKSSLTASMKLWIVWGLMATLVSPCLGVANPGRTSFSWWMTPKTSTKLYMESNKRLWNGLERKQELCLLPTHHPFWRSITLSPGFNWMKNSSISKGRSVLLICFQRTLLRVKISGWTMKWRRPKLR